MRHTLTISIVWAATSLSALTAQQSSPRRTPAESRRAPTTYVDVGSLLTAIEPALAAAQIRLSAMAPQLEAMHAQMAAVQPRLDALHVQLAPVHFSVDGRLHALEAVQPALDASYMALASITPGLAEIPLLRGQDGDSAAYRRAREEVNKRNFERAAELFEDLIDRYPRSSYADDAYYWQAYSLHRLGGTDNLESAKRLLDVHRRRFPSANSRSQADQLLLSVQTDLARSGDAEQAEQVARTASRVLDQQCPRRDDEDLRAVALNSLMQMGPENALPVIKQIMAKKDACSAPLRRKADVPGFATAQLGEGNHPARMLHAMIPTPRCAPRPSSGLDRSIPSRRSEPSRKYLKTPTTAICRTRRFTHCPSRIHRVPRRSCAPGPKMKAGQCVCAKRPSSSSASSAIRKTESSCATSTASCRPAP